MHLFLCTFYAWYDHKNHIKTCSYVCVCVWLCVIDCVPCDGLGTLFSVSQGPRDTFQASHSSVQDMQYTE